MLGEHLEVRSWCWGLQSYGSGDSSQNGIPKSLQGNPAQAAIEKVSLHTTQWTLGRCGGCI